MQKRVAKSDAFLHLLSIYSCKKERFFSLMCYFSTFVRMPT